jgi:hypothetical protein
MRIFLSYRREDSAAWAGRLHDSLAARFGENSIFQDVVAIRPGADFTDAIDQALDRSDAALAVIGPRWLTVVGPNGEPRLSQADDYVRAELVAALAHGLPVVPVLVGGAAMPGHSDLLPELQPLALRQAVVLRDSAWHQDVEALIKGLRGEQPAGRRSRRPAVTALAAVVALAIVGLVVAWALRGRETSDDTSLTGCPGPETEDWTDVALAGTPSGRSDAAEESSTFVVTDARQRRSPPEAWEVVLSVTATNEAGPDLDHESWFYELVVDGVEFDPSCFDLMAGNNPLKSGSSNDVRVGFEVTRDPAISRLELDVDPGGQPTRIVLTDPTG